MSTRSTAASTRGWTSFWKRLTIRRLLMTMTDVDQLLRDYIERFEAGGSVDPSDLLARASTDQDRRKLSDADRGLPRARRTAAGVGRRGIRGIRRRPRHRAGRRGLGGGGRRAAGRARPAAKRAKDHPRGPGQEARRLPRCLRHAREGRLLLPPPRTRCSCRPRVSPGRSGTRSPACSDTSDSLRDAAASARDAASPRRRRSRPMREQLPRRPRTSRSSRTADAATGASPEATGAEGTRRGGPALHRRLVSPGVEEIEQQSRGGARRRAGVDLERRAASRPGGHDRRLAASAC